MRSEIEEPGMWEKFRIMLMSSLFLHILMFIAIVVWSSHLSVRQWPVVPVYTVNLVDVLGPAEVKQSSEIRKKSKEFKQEEPKPKEKKEKKPAEEPKKIVLASIEKEEKKPEKPKMPAKKKEKPTAKAKKKEEKPVKKEEPKVQKEEMPREKISPGKPQPSVAPLVVGNGGKGDGKSYRGSLFLDGWTQFPFTYYLLLIRNRIGDNWNPSLAHTRQGSLQKVVIAFKIYRDGRISNPFVEEASGIPFLDQTALRAVLSSAPFPPLPTGFEEKYLGVHFGFEYNYTG